MVARTARLLLLALALLLPAAAVAPRCRSCRRSAKEEAVCAEALDTSQPVPRTAKKPQLLRANSTFSDGVPHTRTDDYGWLRDDYHNNTKVLSHLQEGIEAAYINGRVDRPPMLPAEATAVLSHLQEENAYAEAVMAPSKVLQTRLQAEMLARIPQEEASVPQRQGRHWYYSVHGVQQRYRRHCRRPIADPEAAPSEHDAMDLEQPEEVLLDEDELAGADGFFDLAGLAVSPDEQLMAYGVDREGGEVYALFVRNLTAGSLAVDPADSKKAYGEEFRRCTGDLVFLRDNRTLLFTTQTAGTHRADKVWRFDVTAPADMGPKNLPVYRATLLFHEADERYHLALWRSRSDAVVYLRGASETTHYLMYMRANRAVESANFTMLAPPVQDQQYLVRDWHSSSSDGSSSGDSSDSGERNGEEGRRDAEDGDTEAAPQSKSYLYAVIYTGEQRNGQLVVTQLGPNALGDAAAGPEGERQAPAPEGVQWALLQAHSRDVEIVDLTVSSGYLAVLERRNGSLVATAYSLPSDGSPLETLPKAEQFSFDAPSYSLWLGDQGPFASPLLRVRYSSLTQPLSTYDINMRSGNRVLKQQQEVQGFDHTKYLSRLLWAKSTGDVAVPISLAYRGDVARLDGTDPLLLEAYGAYGTSNDPEFSGARLSLLDRGFVYAVAHVRGGGELGRFWYQDGKLLRKNHTFDDTIACAEFLIQAKYSSPRRMSLWGRSAGGLTAAAAVNRRPDLFRSAILDVPFVDVVTTMSDPSLPLTVVEWEEWGNPVQDEAAYQNMLSYSPLDNVAKQPYPHLLLTAGLNDPRVAFWEPAKLAAKVRDRKTSPDSLVLLRTNMAAGHFAQSGLEDRLAETAFKYAFLLQTVAPCAGLHGGPEPDAGCHGCFAVFVAAATTAALVTLVVVLRPASRLSRNWRRLGGGGRLRGLGGAGGLSDEDEDDEQGYDTRLYSPASHLSDRELAEEAALEANRQRRQRQAQLEQQGLSLTAYEDIRSAVRSQLQPIPAPPLGAADAAAAAAGVPAGVGAAPASLPPRRLTLGGAAGAAGGGGGSVELAQINGGSGRALSAIPESPTLSNSSLMSA